MGRVGPLLALALAMVALDGPAAAADPLAGISDVVSEPLAGGRHVRLVTAHGPVHAWIPGDYRSERAGIALYVHGYFTDVDRAFTEHKLAEQFRKSGRNALFIVPEAPAGGNQVVAFADLDDLVLQVREALAIARPWGPVVAMVHSGGYRTARAWLDCPNLDQVILLDALYGDEEAFSRFVHRPSKSLVVVGADTLRWTEPFEREARRDLTVRALDQLPGDPAHIDLAARAAPVLYLRAQFTHMDLVESDKAIPILFAASRLGPVFARPSDAVAR